MTITFPAKDPARDTRPAGPVLTELVQELERVITLGGTASNLLTDEEKEFYRDHPLSYNPTGVTLHSVALWLDSKIMPKLTRAESLEHAASSVATSAGLDLTDARDLVNDVIRIFGLEEPTP